MYENNTEQAIKQRMLDLINNEIDKTEGSFTYDAISPASVEFAQAYIQLENILKLVFAKTSSGEYLDKRAQEFGLARNPGTKATGVVRFTGTNGVLIPKGTQVQTQAGLVYQTLIQGVILSSTVEVSIEAMAAGSQYNVPSGAINQIPISISGVLSAVNPSATSGGTNVETDESLLARLLLKVQTPATSGNANEYKLWALNTNGVGDAKVFPLWAGNGTVKVVVIDSNKQPASAQILDNVLNYINAIRPIGADVTVVSALGLPINISVTVILKSGYTLEQVTTSISSKVTDFLKSIAFQKDYVSYAQIGSLILESDGVLDYNNLVLNGGTSNVSIAGEEVAVLGNLTINI